MNVNSLDARAFGARGGLGDGLADVIRAIAGGYLQNQDRSDARLDRQATLSAELRRRNEDIGRQDRIRAEDIQRQDARYAVTDADRAWQRDRTESQDAATQAERDRVAGRQGLADALEQASKYGVVPQRPDFVTAPTEREQAVWGAANRGAEDRSLSAELKQAQAREAEARALAAMTKTGKTANSYDRTKFKQVRVTKEDENGDTVTTTELVPIDANPVAAAPAAPARPGEDGKVAFPTPEPSTAGWVASGIGKMLDPSGSAVANAPSLVQELLGKVGVSMPIPGQSAPAQPAVAQPAPAPAPIPPAATAAPVARPAAPSMTLGQVMAAAPWAAGLPPQVVARIAAGRGINLVPDRSDMLAPQQNAPANTAAMR